jgi:hypothetical protein
LDAQAYAVAVHGLEQPDGYEFGMDRDDAREFIDWVKSDPEKHDRYKKFHDGITEYNNSLVLFAYDSGRITLEDATRMLDMHGETYVPFMREPDRPRGMFKRQAGRRGTGDLVELPKAFRRRTAQGSGRPIKDLVQSTIERTVFIIDSAMKQQVHEAMVRQADPAFGGIRGLGGWIDRIDPRQTRHDASIDEILDKLVEEGFVTSDDAVAAREGRNVRLGNGYNPRHRKMLRRRYKIAPSLAKSQADSVIEQMLASEPDPDAIVTIWRPDYRRPNGKHVIKVVMDGKPYLYEVDPQLYDALAMSPQEAMGLIMQGVAAGNRAFKLGATGINTGFAMMNLIADAQTYLVNSRRATVRERVTKAMEWAGKYIATVVKLSDNELVRLYRDWGGDMFSPVGVDRRDVDNTRRKMMNLGARKRIGERPGDAAKILTNGVKGFGDRIRTFVAFTDVGPRIAEAEFILNEYGYVVRDGKIYNLNTGQFEHPPRDVMVKAMMAAGDVTYNYRRSGTKTRKIEQFIPFTNAAVQSLDKTARVYKNITNARSDHAARMQLLSLAMITGIAVAAKLLTADDDDELPGWLRYGYLTYRTGDDADSPILRARVSREHSWLANMILGGVDSILGREDDMMSLRKAMEHEARSKLPMPGGSGTIGVGIELLANRSWFRDRPIEPDYMTDKRKSDRFDERTLGTSKAFAGAMNAVLPRSAEISPLQWEHAASGLTGGAYWRWLDTAERVATKGPSGISSRDIPAWRGFVYETTPQQSVYDFYERISEVKQDAGSGVAGAESKLERMRQYETQMKLLRDLRSKDYDPTPNIVALAREAIGRPKHGRYPHPLYTSVPPEARSELVNHAYSEVRRVAERLGEPMKPGRKESEKEFQHRLEHYESRRNAAIEWIKEHTTEENEEDEE